MSGTAKITGLIPEASAVPTGGVLKLRWAAYPAGDDFRVDASPDAGKTWQSWGRTGGAITTFSKGGAADGEWRVRVVARKAGSDIAGSTSDPITVRVGPAPAPAPTPAPTTPAPAPSPATPTAADFAALAARVAALEKAATAPIRGTGTMTVAIEGQTGQGTARVDMVLTPQVAVT